MQYQPAYTAINYFTNGGQVDMAKFIAVLGT
jgi:hypothetical protein